MGVAAMLGAVVAQASAEEQREFPSAEKRSGLVSKTTGRRTIYYHSEWKYLGLMAL
jgi:hypothetical protein